MNKNNKDNEVIRNSKFYFVFLIILISAILSVSGFVFAETKTQEKKPTAYKMLSNESAECLSCHKKDYTVAIAKQWADSSHAVANEEFT